MHNHSYMDPRTSQDQVSSGTSSAAPYVVGRLIESEQKRGDSRNMRFPGDGSSGRFHTDPLNNDNEDHYQSIPYYTENPYDIINEKNVPEYVTFNNDENSYIHAVFHRSESQTAMIDKNDRRPFGPVRPCGSKPSNQPVQPGRFIAKNKRKIGLCLIIVLVVAAAGTAAGVILPGQFADDDTCPPITHIKNGIIEYHGDRAPGTMATISCREGFILDGSGTVTCFSSYHWSTKPSCKIRLCEPLPEFIKNGNFTTSKQPGATYVFGESVGLTCDDGFHMVGNPLITCLSSGSWSSAPQCISCGTIKTDQWTPVSTCQLGGPIALSHTRSFLNGSFGGVSCHGRLDHNISSIIIGAYESDGTISPGSILINGSRVGEQIIVTTSRYNLTDVTINKSGTFNVTVFMESVACSDEGVYFCGIAADDGGDQNTYRYINKSIIVAVATERKPVLTMPTLALVNRNITFTCDGFIGKDNTGSRSGYMALGIKRKGSASFQRINMNDIQNMPFECGFNVTSAYQHVVGILDDAAEVRCETVIHDDPVLKTSDVTTLRVSGMHATMATHPMVFQVGGTGSISCNVSSVSNWTSLHVYKKPTGDQPQEMFSSNTTTNVYDVADPSVSSTSVNVLADSANVVLNLADVPCGFLDIEEFLCTIETADILWTERIVPDIQVRAAPAELTMSWQIVEGFDTWDDRLFSCVGNVGSPPGHIVIYSDIGGGVMKPFLTTANVSTATDFGYIDGEKNDYGFLEKAMIRLERGTCGYVQSVEFALTNVTRAMHRKRLQCVTVPNSAADAGTEIFAEPKEILVVPDDYCATESVKVVTHPYACDVYVMCEPQTGQVQGVPFPELCRLSNESCFSDKTFTCPLCKAYPDGCARTDVYISGGLQTVVNSSRMEIGCVVKSTGRTLTDIVISKTNRDNRLASYNGGVRDNAAGVVLVTQGAYMNSKEGRFAIAVESVTCGDAGIYLCFPVRDGAGVTDDVTDSIAITVTGGSC